MAFQYEQVLLDQNRHWGSVPYSHEFLRSHDGLSINRLHLQEIQIITGIRRCGKSTLLQTIMNHLMKTQDPKTILYINFDDPNYTAAYKDASQIYSIITAAETMTQTTIESIFLDEVQNVEAWERYVKSAYDSARFKKIVVTGSNANLLNSDYAKLLSGRYIKTHLYPIAFHELLGNSSITTYQQLVAQKALALKHTNTLLQYGGFPRIHCIDNHDERIELLKSYYDTILLKDCIANHSIRDTATLTQLAHYLISNITTLYSYNRLGKIVNSNENTMQQFIRIFKNAYLFDELKSFSYSLSEQLRSNKKIFCMDNGLITATAFQFSDNFGKLFENLIYAELKKTGNEELYFFRDHQECDFILHNPKNAIAVQACYQLTSENRIREISGLQAAMKKLHIKKGFLITYNDEEKITNQILVIPFWKYFSKMI
ncbi:MAG: hypothetical protein A3F11_01270 [Gammaproteobacteria bacterium RIFCSPHIGHO2_12_FULL_37_14]|nr:MAG: hypothetical protein A3F11_01270 [Gammaproteobacteria bacterium RIFCSPHIGHO2_12_FULL_37_14]